MRQNTLIPALLNAVPEPDPGGNLDSNQLIIGEVPSVRTPYGVSFSSRCPQAMEICERVPKMTRVEGASACHLYPGVSSPADNYFRLVGFNG